MNLLEDKDLAFKSLTVITMVFIIVGGLKMASVILTPFLLALFLAIVSASFINFLTRRGIPSFLAWLAVFISIIGFMVIMGFLMSASLYELKLKFPEYLATLDHLVDHYIKLFDLESKVESIHIKEIYHPMFLFEHAQTMVSSFSEILSNTLVVTLTVIFMLVQRHSFVHKVEYLSLTPGSYRHFQKIIEQMDQYILILSVISMLTGITVYVVLKMMDIDFALMWALLAFLFNFIPNIGSFLAAIPPVLLALIQYSPASAATLASAYILINLFYGNVLQPRLIGKGLDLSILVVFLSMIFWGWVFGIVGMLLSVPLTVMVKIILESNEKSRWMGVMLGNDPYENSKASKETL